MNRVRLTHLDSTQASDEDAEHTIDLIGCVVSKRPTLDHKVVCVGQESDFRPVYVHETQKQERKDFESVNPAHFNLMPASGV